MYAVDERRIEGSYAPGPGTRTLPLDSLRRSSAALSQKGKPPCFAKHTVSSKRAACAAETALTMEPRKEVRRVPIVASVSASASTAGGDGGAVEIFLEQLVYHDLD